MEIELECYFKVEEGFFKSLFKNNILTLQPEVLQYLATIAVGTSRGEIHARCEAVQSILQDVVLPPINLTQVIKTPSEYNLD